MDKSTNYEWHTVTRKKKKVKNSNEVVKIKEEIDHHVESWDREFCTPLKYKCKKIEYDI